MDQETLDRIALRFRVMGNRLYRTVRELEPELYRDAVASATSIMINARHLELAQDASSRLGRDIERALMLMILSAKGHSLLPETEADRRDAE